jgi:hypothetical protein
MRRRSSILTILRPFLLGMLLVTASCGDFQAPASGLTGQTAPASGSLRTDLSQGPPSQAPQQQVDQSQNQLTPVPPVYALDSASLPTPTGTAPASTESFGTGSVGDTPQNESAPGQFSPPPHSGTTQLSTSGADNTPPWLSRNGPQPESVESESRPLTKSVTFGWEPSSSGNATGYKIYITTVSALVQHAFDAGPETQFKVDLLVGEKYVATVTAYNAAGESLPSSDFQFDLF